MSTNTHDYHVYKFSKWKQIQSEFILMIQCSALHVHALSTCKTTNHIFFEPISIHVNLEYQPTKNSRDIQHTCRENM